LPGEGEVEVKIHGLNFGNIADCRGIDINGSTSTSGGLTIESSPSGVCGNGQYITSWTPDEIDVIIDIGSDALRDYSIGVNVAAQTRVAGTLKVQANALLTQFNVANTQQLWKANT